MAKPSQGEPYLRWGRAAAGALLALVAILPATIGFKVAIGRVIHWEIVAVLGALGFLGLTLALRYSR